VGGLKPRLGRRGANGEKVSDQGQQQQRTHAEVTKEISGRMTKLHLEYYGRGPEKARTYYVEDLVLVRLDETFTRPERTLLTRGEKDIIQDIRRRFEQHMEADFRAIVEQATGREVLLFLSDTNVESDLSIECFFLRSDLAGAT
jgi:uncharacterized protein YbcI